VRVPNASQKRSLFAHAREVHHGHVHVRSQFAGGTLAFFLLGLGHKASTHAAEKAFLKGHGTIHIHAAILEGATIMTYTHTHLFIDHLHPLGHRHLAHHFHHILHLFSNHFNSSKYSSTMSLNKKLLVSRFIGILKAIETNLQYADARGNKGNAR
jgi:hypothetical protein